MLFMLLGLLFTMTGAFAATRISNSNEEVTNGLSGAPRSVVDDDEDASGDGLDDLFGNVNDPEETPEATDQDNSGTDQPQVTVESEVVSGRVTTYDLSEEGLVGVEVLSGPAFGNVTVNPDNTLAVVLTGTTQTDDISFNVRLTFANGATEDRSVLMNVAQGQQAGGWGLGEFYQLEQDANGNTIVEAGENHEKLYVSGDPEALTLADIAALEGISVSQINWAFWEENPDYGSSPDMALAEDAAVKKWKMMSHHENGPNSNWLLLEKGYSYQEMPIIPQHTTGESELHPIYIGSYGSGDRPAIESSFRIVNSDTANVVVQGLDFKVDALVTRGENIIFEDVISTGGTFSITNVDGITLHDSYVYDVVREDPLNDGELWNTHLNRISGIFMQNVSGALLEGNYVDHNGWEDNYLSDLSVLGGQPPSKYSQNVYLQTDNLDVTVRDNIIMRAAASGLQLRSGGVIEDNLFLDNNGSVMFGKGGEYSAGNYTLMNGNVVTSGAHKWTGETSASMTRGLTNQGMQATLIDNIITHLADPDNLAEKLEKTTTHYAQDNREDVNYDDTIIYNWEGADAEEGLHDKNIDGLNPELLDQTTIQRYTAELLGKQTATIADLGEYLRSQADGELDQYVDADIINAYFQANFGLGTTIRSEATTLRFVPNSLADGVRWDNRLNWDSGDLPGTQDGDSVALGGNWVNYGGSTTNLEDLDFGNGGKLHVAQGKLTIDDHISVDESGAGLSIDSAGQFWTDGYTDQDLLHIVASGGRFANTGLYTGKTQLDVSDNGQAILATDGADYVMGEGSKLSVNGSDTRVGFDGDQGGTAVLLMSSGSELSYTAENGELGDISEFFSGAFERDGAGVRSGANLGDTQLKIDITDLDAMSGPIDLMRVDELIGEFGSVTVVGLAGSQDATVAIDYDADTVQLILGAPGVGSGSVSVTSIGEESSAQGDLELYAALTNGHGIYSDDLPSDIPQEEDDTPLDLI